MPPLRLSAAHLRPRLLQQQPLSLRHLFPRRPYSSPPNTAPTPNRLHRLHARLPTFLQRFTTPLLNAPLTHITSFLLLHELTAVIPLLSLAGFFHYTHWLPPFISEGAWISDGVEKFGRYFRRKGWLGGSGEISQGEVEAVVGEERGEGGGTGAKVVRGAREKWWGRGEGGVRLVVEFATAWAVTKALLPARLVLSVWATPWFARVAVGPGVGVFRRVFGRGKKKMVDGVKAPAGGTGAVGGGAVGKEGGKKS